MTHYTLVSLKKKLYKETSPLKNCVSLFVIQVGEALRPSTKARLIHCDFDVIGSREIAHKSIIIGFLWSTLYQAILFLLSHIKELTFSLP
jgi:hypothetical protein